MNFPKNPTPYQLHKEAVDGKTLWFQHDPTGEGTYEFYWNKIKINSEKDLTNGEA